MAQVTVETVEHVARLANLSLRAEEKETFARQLQEILAYAESIQALDTSAVEPMSHAVSAEVFREDVPHRSLEREGVLASAPDADGAFFRVPRVIAG